MILTKYDNIGFSIGAHIIIFAIMAVGLPHIQRDLKIEIDDVGIEIAFENEVEPEPKPMPTPPPPEPKPEPKIEIPPPPAPEPEPEIAPEPEAEAVPSLEEKPKPKPKEKPKAKPKKLPNMVKAKLPKNILKQLTNNKPKAKPKKKKKEKPKQNRLDSLLKTVEKIDKKPIVKTNKEDKKENDKLANIAKLLNTKKTQQQKSSLNIGGLNNSEMNALRGQIASCWNIQAGAREADKLVVEVLISVDRDKKVRDVRLVGQQFPNDSFWRSAAESAVRAFLNDRCKTLKLPDGKYETWQEIRFKFDPKQMFG